MKSIVSIFLPVLLLFFVSCNNDSKTDQTVDSTSATTHTSQIKEEAVTYSDNGTTLNGYVYYDENIEGKRPIVIVAPEWWGLTDYPRERARKLAELGYFAMAADMYGNGKTAVTPDSAQQLATPLYMDPSMMKSRLDAALEKAKTFPQADNSQAAAIGYCFGGSVVLQAATRGSDLDGAVSFHGGLEGIRPQQPMQTQVLVAHGGSDPFVPEKDVTAFKKAMDSAGVSYTFKVYPSATHAFTNPEATEKGEKYNMPIRYNPQADTASWMEMKNFLNRVFHR